MKYLVWVFFLLACSAGQSMLNTYLPAYLAPDMCLMLTAYITFFFEYYPAVASIIVLSYAASVFSTGSVWFYIFSYISVFYLMIFIKKYFDRSQGVAILVIASISTLLYPVVVLVLSLFSRHMMLFRMALVMALQQIPVNVVFAYLLFKHLPALTRRLTSRLIGQRV